MAGGSGGKTKKKTQRISKKASCIRKTSNTARITRKFLIDSKEYSPEIYTHTTSSKYATLISKIKELDDDDMAKHGTKFKHFIFTDIREGAFGAKAIAGFLAAAGFDFRMTHASRIIRRKGKEVQTRHGTTKLIEKDSVYGGSNSFALLQSLPLWKTPLSVETKKRILTVFNSRPDNIHGEHLRILVLDSKYKEGIDLFDVKYVHLMEPAIASSDLKQAVGRATRFCGQRGLNFVPKRGWPLQVYIYKTILPQRKPFLLPDHKNTIESVDAHELMLANSGIDLALINTTKELTILAILTAVDYDLNYKINNFAAEPAVLDEPSSVLEIIQRGGATGNNMINIYDISEMTHANIEKCMKRKSKLFPFSKSKMVNTAHRLGIRSPKNAKREWYCNALIKYPELYKALIATPSAPPNTPAHIHELFPVPPPLRPASSRSPSPTRTLDPSMDFSEFQTRVRSIYAKYAWDSPVIENGCTSSAIVAPGTPVTFTRTQDFIRHYLTPESPFKGLLAWHSVGTGKTCMAVAAATTEFERAGYNILWVTRNALMADVYKNIFGAVCSIPIAEAVDRGETIPADRSAQLRMLGRQWFKPISYKMFQNALEKNNDLGRQLWKQNPEDPLANTFLVIDEIHKLRDGDLGASEFADFNVIQNFIHKSYEKSGKNSVRALLMTATPITDSPAELFDILNTLIPESSKRLMEFNEFRERFTNATGEINADGRTYFQERAKGLISYLNREYDPTTFAQPEFHTIPVPVTDLVAPTPDGLADVCLAGMEPISRGTRDRKAAAAARRTRKAQLKECYTKQKKEYKKAVANLQMSAITACASGQKGTGSATKFPRLGDFYKAAEEVEREDKDGGEDSGGKSVESAAAVVGANN